MIDYGKRDVLGVGIDAVDLESAVERIMYFAHRRRPYTVSALAVHGVIESRQDPILATALNRFDMVLPDGQPVRWGVNRLHHLDLPDKVPGPTVVDEVLARAADEGLRAFFYGSTPETLAGIHANLDERFGGRLDVRSTPSRFSPADADEQRRIIETINASEANVCFVGLGCPRQERFVASIGPHLAMPSLAVGAAFDYIAGSIERSPELVQRLGLEWAHRLSQDPKRLFRRYLVTNSTFVAAFGNQLVRQRLRRPAGRAATTDATWELVDA